MAHLPTKRAKSHGRVAIFTRYARFLTTTASCVAYIAWLTLGWFFVNDFFASCAVLRCAVLYCWVLVCSAHKRASCTDTLHINIPRKNSPYYSFYWFFCFVRINYVSPTNFQTSNISVSPRLSKRLTQPHTKPTISIYLLFLRLYSPICPLHALL